MPADIEKVRIRLRDQDREIEVEGTSKEVDRLLASWWSSGTERREMPGSSPRSRRQQIQSAAGTSDSAESGSDVLAIVNKVRGLPNVDQVYDRVLHKKDAFRRIALVLSCASGPMTSGEISAVLGQLGVKTDSSGVSHAIRRNIRKLTQTTRRVPGSTPRYNLTSQAMSEFREWVKSG